MSAAQTLADALPMLRAPFSPAAVKWKIQTNPKGPDGSALMVAYIDSRLVAERLNYVCPGDWSDAYAQPIQWSVVCRLTVLGATREDVGWGDLSRLVPNGDKPGEDKGVKTMYSDAFKRAAVKFGIGAFLYAIPKQYVPARDLKQSGRNWYTTRASDAGLLRSYEQWVVRKDVRDRFGAPIDHGDELAAPAVAPAPQNFTHQIAPNAAAFTALAKERGLGVRQVTDLLDAAGAPSGEDVQARINSAPVSVLDAAIERIKGA